MRMRIFQYKILNNFFTLHRQLLYQMKIINSPMCSLCGQNLETVTHLFFICIESHKSSTEIRNWSTSYIILSEFTEKIIFWVGMKVTLIIHCLYKQLIYKNRGARSKINTFGFRHFLKSVINIEKVMAKRETKQMFTLKSGTHS